MADAKGEKVAMPESMDIVKRVDEDPRWGPVMLKPATNREDIKAFFDSIADLSRRCTRPRFAQSAVLPEFHTPAARAAFVRNHPLKPPSDYTENYKNAALGAFFACWLAHLTSFHGDYDSQPPPPTNNPTVAALSEKLKELDPLIHAPDCVTAGGVSHDDIDLFGKTRGLTVVKGLVLPPKLKAYLERMSEMTEVPLYYQMQL